MTLRWRREPMPLTTVDLEAFGAGKYRYVTPGRGFIVGQVHGQWYLTYHWRVIGALGEEDEGSICVGVFPSLRQAKEAAELVAADALGYIRSHPVYRDTVAGVEPRGKDMGVN